MGKMSLMSVGKKETRNTPPKFNIAPEK